MPYDLDELLTRMVGKDYLDILREAEQEANAVERGLHGLRGAPKRREQGGGVYLNKIGQFLFFMRHGIKPLGVYEEDFQRYMPIIQSLVDRGQMKPEALDIFRS